METQKLDEQVSVGAQPGEADIAALAGQGFRSILNLRGEGEEDQPLDPLAEREAVERAGLRYAHVPVSLRNLQSGQVDRFRDEMQSLPAPVYIHCRGGSRARVMAMLLRAVESGRSGEEALGEFERSGLLREAPELREFIRRYVDHHFERGD